MNTLTCKDCGHRGDYHYHDDDLLVLDKTCHDETGHYVCAHFRCKYPWLPRNDADEATCWCLNFVPMDSEVTT